MAHEFRLPDIGEGLAEAEIVRWLVAVGDRVGVDESLVEVETDKAVVDIPSPFEGIVLRHGAREGEVLAVGEVLVVISADGESVDPPVPGAASSGGEGPEPPVEAAPIVGTLSAETTDLTAPVAGEPPRPARRVQALPLVRKLARELGVDLDRVEGTGELGRITRDDVLGAVEEMRPAESGREAGSERRPMSRLRRTIAANMSRSWAEIPHVTTFDEADAGRLLEVRQALARRHGTAIPLDALVMKAVTPVLLAMPEFNAAVEGDELLVRSSVDLGLAVDTPDGLMVAVIRSAEDLGLLELASEVERLGEGARGRTLSPAELTGQSFTVSNIGAVGGGYGTPIIPPGTTAILSVGRAADRPVVEEGEIVVAPMMPLSLSFDHRVIDGALGRRFMATVIENLAEPALFLI